jgi:hypothetical protein
MKKSSIAKFTFLSIFFLSTIVVNAQGIKVLTGENAQIESNLSSFQILDFAGDNLFVYEKAELKKGNSYFLHQYDRQKNYELIKRTAIEIDEKIPGKNAQIKFVKLIGNSIYVIAISKDKKKGTKEYYSIVYDTDLIEKTEWVNFYKVKLIVNTDDMLVSMIDDYEIISFSVENSVFFIQDSNNKKNEEAGDGFLQTIESVVFDLNFKETEEYDDRESEMDIMVKLFMGGEASKFKPEPEGYDEYEILLTHDNDERELLLVSLASEHKKFDHKPSKLSLYYSLSDIKRDSKQKEGKVITLPENIYLDKISCKYDLDANIILIGGYYNSFDDNKNKPAGIFLLKYDVSKGEVLSVSYDKLTDEFRDVLKKSKYLKRDNRAEEYKSFSIKKASDNSYYLYKNLGETSVITSSNILSPKEKVKTEYIEGEAFVFRYGADGKQVSQTAINKFSNYAGSGDKRANKLQIVFMSKDSTMNVVYLDNRNNYTNGVYNQGVSENKFDKNTCLAVTEITKDGAMQRKMLVNSVQTDLGGDINFCPLFKISDSEYICYGYSETTGKIITIKAD